jgi:hypothetical protein
MLGRMSVRKLGGALVVAGGVLALVGVAGMVLYGGGEGRPAATPAPGSTTAQETVEGFLDRLGEAMGSGDAAFLVERLHPAVLDLYGRDACLAAMEGLAQVRFRVRSVGEPETYRWVSDGVRREIPDALTVRVRARTDVGAVIRDVHLARVDGELRWLTDCGDPIA